MEKEADLTELERRLRVIAQTIRLEHGICPHSIEVERAADEICRLQSELKRMTEVAVEERSRNKENWF
jgi:HAMP domain-containing protein